MQNEEKPIVDILTLRRDLYIVMSLLLADKQIAELGNSFQWSEIFFETEVRRLLLWIATATRSLLDHVKRNKTEFENEHCGEYWADPAIEQYTQLTLRQACNSIIHAEEILPYKPLKIESATRFWYTTRITVRSSDQRKPTRSEIDILRFAKSINILTKYIER